MLLADLLPGYRDTRPTSPTTKNLVGRHETLVAVSSFDTSGTSDTKTDEIKKPRREGGILTIFTQVDPENPLSVRHLASDGENEVVEELAEARRLQVHCPTRHGRLHCWNCASCIRGPICTAWHGLWRDVEFFRGVKEPESLLLTEDLLIRGIIL